MEMCHFKKGKKKKKVHLNKEMLINYNGRDILFIQMYWFVCCFKSTSTLMSKA